MHPIAIVFFQYARKGPVYPPHAFLRYRGMYYPPCREKLHGLGALEMALWDIKGKALNVPVYDLIGRSSRDDVECYATGSGSHSRCLMELAGGQPEKPAYFNDDYLVFGKGKLYLNPAPGPGVEFDPKKATFEMEITEKTKFPHPILKSADGAIHNW